MIAFSFDFGVKYDPDVFHKTEWRQFVMQKSVSYSVSLFQSRFNNV